MSNANIKIRSSRDLEKFLSILAEESVRKASIDLRSSTAEEEMRQASLARDLRNFGKTKEEPTSKNEEDDEQGNKITKKVAQGPEKVAPKIKTEVPPTAKPDEEGNVDKHVTPPSADSAITFTMIKDKLNTIRSGRSLRDKDIRQEFKDYFSALDEAEQSALYAFLDGISQVLSVGVEGEEADSPDKDPHNVEMTKSEDGDEAQGQVKKTVKKHVSSPKVRSSSGEDTSPPISVGSRQRTEALRLRLRELMG